jgi:hypothetical protein
MSHLQRAERAERALGDVIAEQSAQRSTEAHLRERGVDLGADVVVRGDVGGTYVGCIGSSAAVLIRLSDGTPARILATPDSVRRA